MRTTLSVLVAGIALLVSTEASAATSSCVSLIYATYGAPASHKWQVTVSRSCDGALAVATVPTTEGEHDSSVPLLPRWSRYVSAEVRAMVLAGYVLSSCTWANDPLVTQCVFTK